MHTIYRFHVHNQTLDMRQIFKLLTLIFSNLSTVAVNKWATHGIQPQYFRIWSFPFQQFAFNSTNDQQKGNKSPIMMLE